MKIKHNYEGLEGAINSFIICSAYIFLPVVLLFISLYLEYPLDIPHISYYHQKS